MPSSTRALCTRTIEFRGMTTTTTIHKITTIGNELEQTEQYTTRRHITSPRLPRSQAVAHATKQECCTQTISGAKQKDIASPVGRIRAELGYSLTDCAMKIVQRLKSVYGYGPIALVWFCPIRLCAALKSVEI